MLPSVMGKPFENKSELLQIHKQVVQRLFTEGREALPKEYTALLAGHGKRITNLYSSPHSDTDIHTFAWSGPALLESLRRMKQEKEEWLGVVHTHPTTPPLPSSSDIAGWHYPELSYWITSFIHNENELCSYQMVNGVFVSVPFAIV